MTKMNAGDVYGRWTVLEYAGTAQKGELRWLCRCACGTVRSVLGTNLRKGKAFSCGCYNKERLTEANTKHGAYKTPEFTAWSGMLERCCNPRSKKYTDYGGRGITVYPGWRKNFTAFLAHVGPRPSPRHQIDRIDNDVGYVPGNVKWSLPRENANNKRNTIYVDGIPLADLARSHGISHATLLSRFHKGWDLEELLRPVRSRRTKCQMLEEV